MKLQTRFSFDASHRLVGYDGPCNNLHGHRWEVIVEIEGDEFNGIGMLWDFTNVKEIKNLLDHKTILWEHKDNQDLIYAINKTCGSSALYIMDGNPTAENLCRDILSTLVSTEKTISTNQKLKFKVTVYESPKSYAEESST